MIHIIPSYVLSRDTIRFPHTRVPSEMKHSSGCLGYRSNVYSSIIAVCWCGAIGCWWLMVVDPMSVGQFGSDR